MTAVSRQVTDTPSVGEEGTGNAGRPRACRYTTIPSKIKSRTASHGLRCIREPTTIPMDAWHASYSSEEKEALRASGSMRDGDAATRAANERAAAAATETTRWTTRWVEIRPTEGGRAAAAACTHRFRAMGTEPVWPLTTGEAGSEKISRVIAQVASLRVAKRQGPRSRLGPVPPKLRIRTSCANRRKAFLRRRAAGRCERAAGGV